MSKIAAIASRQRDWRRRAKSEIAIGRRPGRGGHLRELRQPGAVPAGAVDDEAVGHREHVVGLAACRTAARPATRP